MHQHMHTVLHLCCFLCLYSIMDSCLACVTLTWPTTPKRQVGGAHPANDNYACTRSMNPQNLLDRN